MPIAVHIHTKKIGSNDSRMASQFKDDQAPITKRDAHICLYMYSQAQNLSDTGVLSAAEDLATVSHKLCDACKLLILAGCC